MLPQGKGFHWKEIRDFAFTSVTQTGAPELKWNQPFPQEIPQFPARYRGSDSSSSSSSADPQSSYSSDRKRKVSRAQEEVENPQAKAIRAKLSIPAHCIPLPPAHLYARNKASSSSPADAGAGTGAGDGSGAGAGAHILEKNQRLKRIAALKAVQTSLTKIETAAEKL